MIYGGYGGEGERKRESFRRRILAIGKSDGEERGQEGGREGGREGEKQEANSRNPRRREGRRGKGRTEMTDRTKKAINRGHLLPRSITKSARAAVEARRERGRMSE